MKTESMALDTVLLNGEEVNVILIYRARRSIRLQVNSVGVEMVAPKGTPVAWLKKVLNDKLAWLTQHHAVQKNRQAEQETLPETMTLCGQPFQLIVLRSGRASFTWTHDSLLIQGSEDTAQLKATVALALQTYAQQYYPLILAQLSMQGPRPYAACVVSQAKTRWGSCTQDGVIRLNWRLLLAPLPVLHYVMQHELGHLQEMNHSTRFWAIIEKEIPDWRTHRAWLKLHGHQLFIFDER
ncbi:MAG: M48 family metallopeptidase [Neisseriaceae bacterium]|nr:M48 family metallopeptidase [Neisseriaceae bacterium]